MTKPLKVLYIDGVGPFGGASRSLYEAMKAFPEGAVERYFVMQEGTAGEFYGRVAKGMITTRGITRFDNTRASHYRGVRWIVPLRELVWLPFTGMALLKARRRWKDIDLIHVNEVHEIFAGVFAKLLFRTPMIVHVRSLQRLPSERSRRTALMNWMLRRYADAVIAIDENVRATLPAEVAPIVIHNSFQPTPSEAPDSIYLAQLDNLRSSSLKVGFVGNLHQNKGTAELFEAAKLVKAGGHDVQFLLVGGNTSSHKGLKAWLLRRLGLAQDLNERLVAEIDAAGLADDFLLLGATKDIQRVYSRVDVVAFPSYFDAPGRPVFEAAFYGVPAIVAVRNPRPDTFVDGETGVAIAEPDPELLAAAIVGFANDRSSARRMGDQAKALAERNFVPRTNSAKMLELYRRLVPA